MSEKSPNDRLKGVTAVWTGSNEAAGELLVALERAKATIERHPLITIGPPADPERAREVLGDLNRYSWILFTSAQAAQAVRGLPPPRGRVAAVGPATAARLRDAGWQVSLVPQQHDAQGLIRALEDSESRGKALFVRGDKARRTLPEGLASMGFDVEEAEVYSTQPVDMQSARAVARRIAEVAELAIMGSPSGVTTLAEAVAPGTLSGIKPGLKWVCLGRTTNEALRANGIDDAVFPEKIEPKLFVQTVVKVIES